VEQFDGPTVSPFITISRVVNGRMERAFTRALTRFVPWNSTIVGVKP
jgi:hypothetical protein